MKTLRSVSSSIILFPIFFLAFFQLAVTVLSITLPSFQFEIGIGAIIAIITCWFIVPKISCRFLLSTKQILIIGALAFANAFLFLLRLNWHIFDYICPTGVLGLVTQVSGGKFPASFISFPEFPMNYHQGFILIAGTLSYVTSMLPSAAIVLTYTFLYTLLVIAVSLFFVLIKNTYYYLPAVLFLLLASIHAELVTGIDFGWYNYLSVFEYAGSNSWPLALLLFVGILFWLQQYNHTPSNIIIGSLLLLSMATVNGTIFSVLVLALLIWCTYYCSVQKRVVIEHLLLAGTALGAVIVIPHFIPSVFLAGPMYTSPDYGIRVLDFGFNRTAKHIARYILLGGPIIIFSLLMAYSTYRKRLTDWRSFILVFFLVAWTFPIFIGFSNIDVWDNFHKFAVISLFLSILIVTLFFTDNPLGVRRTAIFVGICIMMSLPSLYDMATNRLSLTFTTYVHPPDKITDVVQYLHGEKRTIIPYRTTISEACGVDGYAGIAQYSGNSLRYTYFNNFLLSEMVEAKYEMDRTWDHNPTTRLEGILSLPEDAAILVNEESSAEFLGTLEQIPETERRTVRTFNHYLLYE